MDKRSSAQHLIGICISNDKREFQKLVKERLERYPGDVTLVKFHMKDLDFENLHVKGDYLEKKEGEINRKQGVFPLPDVVYMQCHVDDEVVKKIEQVGRMVFNSFIFDKWQCWDLLAKDNELRDHLPNTWKMESETDLQQLLYNYKDVLLKPLDPIRGHSSRGIFRLKLQTEAAIEAIYWKKDTMRREGFESVQTFWKWFSRKFSTKSYIIQQSIQTVKWDQKVTDIRLNMNKNGKGEWEASLLLFRIASNDSHIMPGILASLPFRHLTQIFPHDKNMENIETAVVNLGFKICHTLDESGHHMADLGIDLGMDENGLLWIFEVNPLPFPLRGQDHSFTRPLEYACFLASQYQQKDEENKDVESGQQEEKKDGKWWRFWEWGGYG